MLSAPIESVIKMMETLPEGTQKQVAEHLREYLEDILDEQKWDKTFEQTQDQLVLAARRAKQHISVSRGS